jgi:hypothetical protein
MIFAEISLHDAAESQESVLLYTAERFDSTLHHATGSQFSLLDYAAGSQISLLKNGTGNHDAPLHDAAGRFDLPPHYAERSENENSRKYLPTPWCAMSQISLLHDAVGSQIRQEESSKKCSRESSQNHWDTR